MDARTDFTSSVLVQFDEQRAGAPLLCRQVEGVGVAQSGELKALGRPYRTLQCLKGVTRDLFQGHEVKGHGGMALN